MGCKAEEDYETVVLLQAHSRPVFYPSICFHIQQCIEKYLKALLAEENIYFPKTYDLSDLLDLLLERHPHLELHRQALQLLSRFAFEYRYPGTEQIQHSSVQSAMDILHDVRDVIRSEISALGGNPT